MTTLLISAPSAMAASVDPWGFAQCGAWKTVDAPFNGPDYQIQSCIQEGFGDLVFYDRAIIKIKNPNAVPIFVEKATAEILGESPAQWNQQLVSANSTLTLESYWDPDWTYGPERARATVYNYFGNPQTTVAPVVTQTY
ncbi:hypothetical protein GTY86_19305 [Streptomyces sp. SID5770]|uniref:hypothetical protein n=1 Tax=Streptomyces sp. SID5770 TaxID=2690308 RepID=UPI0013682BE6|nr:hypothetical protein [Streptomyces sp. SID5770]MZE53382.1 hypothetical protein [Streptomyces sp. SID5770]